MSEQRTIRKEKQATQQAPVNFTCGKCKKVQPFTEGYRCVDCDPEEEE